LAKKKGFNEYKIEGNTTILYFTDRKKNKYKILIDTEDLQKLIDFGYPWGVAYKPDIDSYYAKTTQYISCINRKVSNKNIELHRFIMNANKGEYIDHINHNTLDNRKENLRITRNNQNIKNRKGKNKNNKSGYRNVSWNNFKNQWVVQLQVNGENTQLGYFDNVDDAGKFAEEMREKYYGEFKGAS